MASGTAILDFGAFPGASDAKTVIVGQSTITASANIEPWIRRAATADHSEDEHSMTSMLVSAGDIVPGIGFTIYGVSDEPFETLLVGQYSVGWAWL